MTVTPWVRNVLTGRPVSLGAAPRVKNARFGRHSLPAGPGTIASVKAGPADQGPTTLTRDTYERLQAELEDLTTRGRVEIAQAIEAARALGDLSENGDYHAAKDAQGKMESRIRHLQALLKRAEVLDDVGASNGTVTTGTVVRLRYEGDDEDDVQEFFFGSIEERRGDLPVVSPNAPLGQVLAGRGAGDVVEYEAPGGSLRVIIVEVSS